MKATVEVSPQLPVRLAAIPADATMSVLVGAIVLGTSTFLARWAFTQISEQWTKRIEKLEAKSERQEEVTDKIENAVSHLTKATDELAKHVSDLVELNRTVILLSERQNTFDQRLQNFGGALQQLQALYQDSERAALALKTELATNYLRREDWQRFANTLEAKMDGLNRKQEEYKEFMIEVLRK